MKEKGAEAAVVEAAAESSRIRNKAQAWQQFILTGTIPKSRSPINRFLRCHTNAGVTSEKLSLII
jgi:hypothetical protein